MLPSDDASREQREWLRVTLSSIGDAVTVGLDPHDAGNELRTAREMSPDRKHGARAARRLRLSLRPSPISVSTPSSIASPNRIALLHPGEGDAFGNRAGLIENGVANLRLVRRARVEHDPFVDVQSRSPRS